MFVPKEIALNIAIMLPPVRALARDRHETGMNNAGEVVESTYQRLRKHFDTAAKDVLELGPGQTFGLLLRALEDGARSAVGLDIERYELPQAATRLQMSYYDGKRMPFADASFDAVWSNVCLEHARYPELTVSEIARVLRPGGVMLSSIDLRDHYHSEPELQAEHLRYGEWIWRAMTWNRSAYTNRLRMSDWRRLLQDSGFTVRLEETELSEALRQGYATHPARHRYTEIDFCTVGVFVVADLKK